MPEQNINGIAAEKKPSEQAHMKSEVNIPTAEKGKKEPDKQAPKQKSNANECNKQTNQSSKVKYNDKQVEVLRKFIRAGYGIEDVKNPELSEKQLKELYLGKKAGIDISLYCSPKVSAEVMKDLRKTAAAGIDLKDIAQT